MYSLLPAKQTGNMMKEYNFSDHLEGDLPRLCQDKSLQDNIPWQTLGAEELRVSVLQNKQKTHNPRWHFWTFLAIIQSV